MNRASQNYWGVRYIDDYVSKRIDRAPASTGESELSRTFDDGTTASNRYVFLTDAQFSVVATADHTGGLIDRVSYTPYGVPEHRYAADVDGDGSVDTDDVNLIFPASIAEDEIGDAGYNADYDLDGPDGVVNSDDYSAFAGEYSRTYTLAAMPGGWIADPGDETGPDNSIGYCGYVTDTEAGVRNAVRFRYYDPWMGRWLTRDPLGYLAGMHLQAYVDAQPVSASDFSGLLPECTPCLKGKSVCTSIGLRLTRHGNKPGDIDKVRDSLDDIALLMTILRPTKTIVNFKQFVDEGMMTFRDLLVYAGLLEAATQAKNLVSFRSIVIDALFSHMVGDGQGYGVPFARVAKATCKCSGGFFGIGKQTCSWKTSDEEWVQVSAPERSSPIDHWEKSELQRPDFLRRLESAVERACSDSMPATVVDPEYSGLPPPGWYPPEDLSYPPPSIEDIIDDE